MNRILVVVDMQKDFIDGALGTAEAVSIVDRVVEKIENWDGSVIATRDTHTENYLNTLEGKNLPVVHCVRGTAGWDIDPKVAAALDKKGAEVVDKPTFGSMELARMILGDNMGFHDGSGPVGEVQLVGLCTGICVISNALLLKAAMPNVPVKVDAACCACVTPDSHKTALEAMKLCQVEILSY